MMEELLLFGLAVYYVYRAYESTTDSYRQAFAGKLKFIWWLLERKPFSCEVCMMFWFAVILYLLPAILTQLFAFAGIALLIHNIVKRLETVIL